MTKRGPDSVTIALEELMRMEDERVERERLEQERKQAEEEKKRKVLAQAIEEAQKQEKQKTRITKNPLLNIEEELASKKFDIKDTDLIVPWYKKRNFKTGLLAFVIAIVIVAFIRFGVFVPTVEEEYVVIPEYVTIQEFEELEGQLNYLNKRIDKLYKIARENEKIANEKHLQIYNRVGLYDIRAHERVDTLEDRIADLENPKPKKKTKRRRRKVKKPEPEKDTGLSDDPMGGLSF